MQIITVGVTNRCDQQNARLIASWPPIDSLDARTRFLSISDTLTTISNRKSV